MSVVRCIGTVAATGGIIAGGLALGKGIVRGRQIMKTAGNIAAQNGGKIPTGGRTKDGGFWDGFTTVEAEKKKVRKTVAIMTGATAIAGALLSAAGAALTLLVQKGIK